MNSFFKIIINNFLLNFNESESFYSPQFSIINNILYIKTFIVYMKHHNNKG